MGIGYSETNIQVVTSTGTYTAVTYVASYVEDPLPPYQWYKASVIAGAIEHGLPNEYVSGCGHLKRNRTQIKSAEPRENRSYSVICR